MWITEYPSVGARQGRAVYTPPELAGMEAGVVALYQKCVHLGCRVPRVRDVAVVRVPVPRLAVQPGRREEGRPGARAASTASPSRSPATSSPSTPAPIIQGPPIGTNTTGQEAEGPHCVGGRRRTDAALHHVRPCWPTSTAPSVGAVILVVVLVIGVVVYVFVNVRSGQAEVGSEIELAPNRKPYLADEELEGPSSTAR